MIVTVISTPDRGLPVGGGASLRTPLLVGTGEPSPVVSTESLRNLRINWTNVQFTRCPRSQLHNKDDSGEPTLSLKCHRQLTPGVEPLLRLKWTTTSVAAGDLG